MTLVYVVAGLFTAISLIGKFFQWTLEKDAEKRLAHTLEMQKQSRWDLGSASQYSRNSSLSMPRMDQTMYAPAEQ